MVSLELSRPITTKLATTMIAPTITGAWTAVFRQSSTTTAKGIVRLRPTARVSGVVLSIANIQR